MFCKNCGKEIDDQAVVCPNCGVPVTKAEPVVAQPQNSSNTMAIVGFVFAFLVPIVGLICSIMGLNNAKKFAGPNYTDYKGLAIAGIIISVVEWVLSMIIFIVVFAAAAAM